VHVTPSRYEKETAPTPYGFMYGAPFGLGAHASVLQLNELG